MTEPAPPPTPTPKLYVVDLGTGEVTGGPDAPNVQHYVRETGDLIVHAYDPVECERCSELRAMGSPDPRRKGGGERPSGPPPPP